MQAFEDLDDSDADKDYEPGSEEDDIDTEDEGELDVVLKQHGPTPEFRIAMAPPIERADADTDCDSGKLLFNAPKS